MSEASLRQILGQLLPDVLSHDRTEQVELYLFPALCEVDAVLISSVDRATLMSEARYAEIVSHHRQPTPIGHELWMAIKGVWRPDC